MVDMLKTITPKSDQLNADDLIGGSRTITITGVAGNDNADQPVSINFEGDDKKPYKPCKSMRRVMVHVWGFEAKQYVGRSMTLYCDPEVQFGGMKVGGIRISHMSHMEKAQTMALTASKAKRKPFTVLPMPAAPKKDEPEVTPEDEAGWKKLLQNCATLVTLQDVFKLAWRWGEGDAEAQGRLKAVYDTAKERFA